MKHSNTRDQQLDILSWNNQLEAVSSALEHQKFNQEQLNFALYKACHQGHLKVVDLLMDYGAQIDSTGVLNGYIAACSNNHINVVMFLLNKNCVDVSCMDNLALINASKAGYADLTELLLDCGADVNARQGRALLNSCLYNHPDVVDVLMYAGADAKANNAFAFNTACSKGFIGVVEVMLEHGVDAQANYNSASRNAKGYPRILQLLKTYGAGEQDNVLAVFKAPQNVDFKFEKFLNMVLSAKIAPEVRIIKPSI